MSDATSIYPYYCFTHDACPLGWSDKRLCPDYNDCRPPTFESDPSSMNLPAAPPVGARHRESGADSVVRR